MSTSHRGLYVFFGVHVVMLYAGLHMSAQLHGCHVEPGRGPGS